jgi:hypothetical protein
VELLDRLRAHDWEVVTAEAPLLDSSLDEELEPLDASPLPEPVPELVADSVLVDAPPSLVEDSVLVVGVLSAVEESVLFEAVDAFEEPVLVLALAVRLALATRAGSWPEASCT